MTSGACVANPLYKKKEKADKEAMEFLNLISNDDYRLRFYTFICEETGTTYTLSNQSDVSVVVENVSNDNDPEQLNG